MPYRPHRLEVNYPGPEVVTSKSPAPPIIVAAWLVMVERMDRLTLDRFTRRIWRKFDAKDLDDLRDAILRRRHARRERQVGVSQDDDWSWCHRARAFSSCVNWSKSTILGLNHTARWGDPRAMIHRLARFARKR
jgi:hypothetical protein